MSGRWQPAESAGAPCFACGPDARCQINAQYCHVTIGGPAGSVPAYRCLSVPDACRPTPTCACLRSQAASSATTCQQNGPGQLTVTFAAP